MAKKILIIEDEELLLNLLKKKLSELGYEVFTAIDGLQGLEGIKEIVPDLILLDIVMPKMGGFELLEKKQEDDSIKNIPVIIISNSGQPVELEKAKQLGANDWLVKTEFDPVEVVEKVIKQIGDSNNN
ncbi:response regulator [Patescibacteria group bacterium]|nr:response regulator [Patescibacteria group bacterium]MBU4162031.1 response regulator [Patescibacteria group bacterium]